MADPLSLPDDLHVDLELSPHVTLARIARTTASACASITGYDVEQLADLRLLVDEVFNVLLEVGTGDVRLRLEPAVATLVIELSALAADERGWRLSSFPLMCAVVEVTADVARFDVVDGRLVLHVRLPSPDG